ncbi:YhdT family protein [Halobacillus litoralis]|uniref:YhdT family protein n=1 Tax=Halobacillus litoralis TaxID=45668 RepID=UPI001CD566C2|nr:YhdT family protein [Halobacillus litoralis]MCA0971469.1 YhdT family protein [Halobacillus litoralis]
MKELKEIDSRFKIANREALIGVALAIFNFGWWFFFAYGLGDAKPEEYSYVFGFPAWFFYSCIAGFVVMAVLVIVVVKFWFVEVSFDEEEES